MFMKSWDVLKRNNQFLSYYELRFDLIRRKLREIKQQVIKLIDYITFFSHKNLKT